MKVLWLRPNKSVDISVGRHRVAQELRARGHTVEIRNTTPSDFLRVLGDSPDVVVGTTRLGAIVGAWNKLLRGVPVVIDHIDPIAQLERTARTSTVWIVDTLEKFSFRIADAVTVVYDDERDRVESQTSAVTMTSLGVDYDLFSNPSKRIITRARQTLADRIPSDERIAIYVGGLEPSYNISTIVDAIDTLEGWHLVVLGDGDQREWLEQLDQERSTIHYLGTVPYEEVAGFMTVSDVGVSLIDDQNTLKVLEYAACGLPIVHAEGVAESRYPTSIEFCSVDPQSVGTAIQAASKRDTEQLTQFARNHDWSVIADTYEEVLQTAVSMNI